MIDEKLLLEKLQTESDKWSDVYNDSKSRGRIDLFVGGMSDAYEGAISIVKELGPGWIRVTEKLPSDNGEPVLVTTVNGILFIAVYEPEEKVWWHFDYEYMVDVIAWMPLPKPYREESGTE